MNGKANGNPWTYDDAARMAHTLGQRGPLSASERDQQREQVVAAVDGMATVLKETVLALDVERRRVNVLDDRGRSFLGRLRWLVLGR